MTLIEVLIAAAMLGIGVTGIVSSWATVTGLLEHQRRLGEANTITRSQLEQILLLPSRHARLSPGTLTLGTFDVFGRPVPTNARNSYAVVSEIRGNTPGPGFIEVTVRTAWTEGTRTPEPATLTTYREQ